MPFLLRNSFDINPEDKVIGFSGSPRKNGNSDILLKTIASGVAQEKISVDYWNLTDIQFKGCIGCEKCRKTKICTGIIDGMTSLYKNIVKSKGIILVSPSHNYNITSWMKAFIDRLYCFYNFGNDRPRNWSSQLSSQNRKAIIAAVCEQESPENMGFTLEAMKRPLESLGYKVIGELSIFKIFDKAKIKQDNIALHKAYQLGRELADSLKY